MKKILILSADIFKGLERKDIKTLTTEQISKGNKVLIAAREGSKLRIYKEKIAQYVELDKYKKDIIFKTRDEVTSILKNNKDKNNYFIVIGSKDRDLITAATFKLLYVVPTWCDEIQPKAQKYGIKSSTVDNLDQLVDIVNNQVSWFYRLDLDEKTTILSLTNANTFGTHTTEEITMINGFRDLLKKGNKAYFNTLLYHFLAAISNNNEFREINDWAIFPSSDTELNPDMWEFKEKARELMNGRKKEPILIRHTKTFKSHEANVQSIRLPCDRHFDTIKLNDYYKGKLKNRVVCVFDDYLTNGTSFETARNLLLNEGAKKIFFVSLGKFHKKSSNQYLEQRYTLKGSLYEPDYSYTLDHKKWHYGEFDENAINEIENLYNIINR